MKVCKFGGSSVATAGQIDAVCRIVEADAERRIVVVSAPGKRHSDDTKVTDLLIALAEARLSGVRLKCREKRREDSLQECSASIIIAKVSLRRLSVVSKVKIRFCFSPPGPASPLRINLPHCCIPASALLWIQS